MKLAFSVENNEGLGSRIDPRFGRAAGLMLVDSETLEFSYRDNAVNLNSAQGAGIQAAQNVIDAGAEGIILGHCGPKAFRVLDSAGVDVFLGGNGTVGEMIVAYGAGTLQLAQAANVEGHWQG